MRRWLAAGALVTVGWLASPTSVPVYDGVGSDDPYRFVGKSPAPASVSITADVTNGSVGGLSLQTGETGPQAIVDVAAGAFTSTAAKVTMTVTPVQADGMAPRGTFDGNAYRVAVAPTATLHPENTQGFLFLRAAVMTKPTPVIVHRAAPGSPWSEVRTSKNGRDIVNTPFRAVGDYAVVRLPGSTSLSAGGLSLVRVLLLGAGVLLLLVITVLVLRRPHDQEN